MRDNERISTSSFAAPRSAAAPDLTPEAPSIASGPRPSRPSEPPSSCVADGDVPPTDRSTEPTLAVAKPLTHERPTITVMTGVNAGQVFTLDGAEAVLGRTSDADVWLDDAGVSRRHAVIRRAQDGTFEIEDLRSTNGTFVRGERVERARLGRSDRVQVGPNVLVRFALTDATEAELQRRLFESSTRDPLTMAFNRKYFQERLAAEIAHAKRHGTKLSVILLDLDDFKSVNDAHGHLTGDLVLRRVSAEVQRLIRAEDIFARWGGEEFALVARSTGRQSAHSLAERIRERIEEATVTLSDGAKLHVTVSVGVASLTEIAGDDPERELVATADRRLYAVKREGRNRVRSLDTPHV